jgi:hypothetical protein
MSDSPVTSTLADHLRAATDEELGALLRLRPDVAVPVPADISQLAGRLQSRVSVARALDGLDRFTLEVLDGLRYVRGEDGCASVETLLTLTAAAGVDSARVRAAVDRLRQLRLVYSPQLYGDDGQLCLVGVLDELMGPYPAGLGRPAAQLVEEAAAWSRDDSGVRGRAAQPRAAQPRAAQSRASQSRTAEGRATQDPATQDLATGGGASDGAVTGIPEPPVDPVALAADPAGLRRALLAAPPEARAVLDRLAEGPPLGQAAPHAASAGPVQWLVEHGLLVAIAPDLVELPREVGLVLRRDAGPLGQLHPSPPPLDGQPRPNADAAGAGQAMEAVRQLDTLLATLGEAGTPRLRTGGLGVRELRRLAKETGIDEATVALLLEIAYAAGLLAVAPSPEKPAGEYPTDERWLPTLAYDTWRAAPIARQWALVARTWLSMTRAPSLVGQRDDRDRVIGALSAEVARLSAPAVRRAVLEVFASTDESVSVDVEAVLAWLAWRYPRRYRRSGVMEHHARATLREAAALGVTGLDALTSYGRILLTERPDPDDDPLGIRGEADELVAALDRLLPAPVDHVLVQADLTVVVPGPPEPSLAAELAAVADAESRGGATVYRVTPTSVRRALDVGFTAADLHALFERRSRTPVPQTLTYLIDDVARRHGGLRVGAAGAYLRSEDENLLAEVLADRRLSPLALRRLAPTVLVTPHAPARLLAALRDAGYAPVPEDATGAVVLTRPTANRANLGRSGPELLGLAAGFGYVDDAERAGLTGPRLAAVVEQIRRGDRIARAASRSPLAKPLVDENGTPISASQAHAQALAVLRQGITERKRVWVGYVDAHGSTGSRLVRPVAMAGGFLHAEDERSQTRHTFALHRITAAALDT